MRTAVAREAGKVAEQLSWSGCEQQRPAAKGKRDRKSSAACQPGA